MRKVTAEKGQTMAKLAHIEVKVQPIHGDPAADEQEKALRKRSGEVDSDDPLVIFLYLLLRDKLTAGEVASLLRDTFTPGGSQFSNGYLANYAKDTAARFHRARLMAEAGPMEKFVRPDPQSKPPPNPAPPPRTPVPSAGIDRHGV